MYREQNYIFSFTFVYKSKTACLKKNPCKKTKKKKKKERKRKKKKERKKNQLEYLLQIIQ